MVIQDLPALRLSLDGITRGKVTRMKNLALWINCELIYMYMYIYIQSSIEFIISTNRLLLPYERYQRGEEEKIRLTHGRRSKSSSVSEESEDIKQETNDSYPSDTPPPVETSLTTASPPLQSIVSTAVS